MTIFAQWEGGSVLVDGDALQITPSDREDEVYRALGQTYFEFESIDESGTIFDTIAPIDPTTPEHVIAALSSLPGAVVTSDARDVTA